MANVRTVLAVAALLSGAMAPALAKDDPTTICHSHFLPYRQQYLCQQAMDGVKTDVFMLADQGWEAYANMIEVRRDLVEKNPALIQKFIDASAIGWYNYLYGGDRKAAYALMKKDNPEMTDVKLDAEFHKLQEMGMVDSGDARAKGIGAMSMERIKRFNDEMVKAGIQAIWNFAPIWLKVPENIFVHHEDLYSSLASLSWKLAQRFKTPLKSEVGGGFYLPTGEDRVFSDCNPEPEGSD